MNSHTHSIVYQFLAKFEGEYCKMCGISATQRRLVVDHIDNDNNNNHPDNYQLLCYKCNYLKNPRRPLDICECVRTVPEIQSEIEINRTVEPLFREYLSQTFANVESMPKKEIVNASASYLDVSPITTSRYLDKECSIEGNYEFFSAGKTIMLRPKQ